MKASECIVLDSTSELIPIPYSFVGLPVLFSCDDSGAFEGYFMEFVDNGKYGMVQGMGGGVFRVRSEDIQFHESPASAPRYIIKSDRPIEFAK